jgi:single-stranded DNA-binding protein
MLQRTELIGRVGKDPQMRFTPDGVPVTSFSAATGKSQPGGTSPAGGGWRKPPTSTSRRAGWSRSRAR